MKSEDLLKYIKGVFDTEINLYVQEKSLLEMKRLHSNLATGLKVYAPTKQQNDESISSNMVSGATVVAVILGVLVAILMFVETYEDSKTILGGIIGGLFLALFSFFITAAIGYGIGLFIGFIIGIIRKVNRQKQINRQFEYDLVVYEQDLSDDKLRLMLEEKKKKALSREISQVENQIYTTRQNLKKMYSYGIIAPQYQDITAVGTFYTYLSSGRTYSLTFDRTTGDKGAYNIYENERRLDIIITNTEEILDRLDDLAYSQRELAIGLSNANAQISSFRNDFNRFANQTSNDLNELKYLESVTAYNTDCILKQTQIMNWLTIMRY